MDKPVPDGWGAADYEVARLPSMTNEAGHLRVAKNSREACLMVQELLHCKWAEAQGIYQQWTAAGDNITERLIEMAIQTDMEGGD